MEDRVAPCFIDTHCHLDLYNEGEISIENIIKNARDSRVKIIVANGVNPDSNRKVLAFAEKYSEIKASLGFYPIDALKYSNTEIDEELRFIESNKEKIIAIGEVGMDFKEDDSHLACQKEVFAKIIQLAIKINKPLIVHSRKAEEEVVGLLEKFKVEKALMHCFSGNFSLVKRIVENNWTLTIPTNVKFSEHFQKIIAGVPIKNLLCETDSPYLHPDKRWPNEPSNVIESYKRISEIKQIPLEKVKKMLFENYLRLFF
jgi:TatD DNase family protein